VSGARCWAGGLGGGSAAPAGPPLYLVGFVGGEAVALEEIGGLGRHLVEEDSGVTLETERDGGWQGDAQRVPPHCWGAVGWEPPHVFLRVQALTLPVRKTTPVSSS